MTKYYNKNPLRYDLRTVNAISDLCSMPVLQRLMPHRFEPAVTVGRSNQIASIRFGHIMILSCWLIFTSFVTEIEQFKVRAL